jgi:hypothetical protein
MIANLILDVLCVLMLGGVGAYIVRGLKKGEPR